MKAAAVIPLLASLASSSPVELEERQSCPGVHVFGARETTAPAGYGTSQGLVNMVTQAYPGATAEAITYPACGGQGQCGGVSYDDSANQGTAAVVKAVTDFHTKCPDTKIVLIGYSQVSLVTHTRPTLSFPRRGSRISTGTDTHSNLRAARSWTMPSAAVRVQPSPVTPSPPSRPASSWATRTTSPAFRTTLALALPEE